MGGGDSVPERGTVRDGGGKPPLRSGPYVGEKPDVGCGASTVSESFGRTFQAADAGVDGIAANWWESRGRTTAATPVDSGKPATRTYVPYVASEFSVWLEDDDDGRFYPEG